MMQPFLFNFAAITDATQKLLLGFAAAILPFATPAVVIALMKLAPGINHALGRFNNPDKGPIDKVKKGLTEAKERADAKRAERAGKLAEQGPPPKYGRFRKKAWELGSAGGRAQRTKNRERMLEEAKQGAARAGEAYYANRLTNDTEFARHMAGGKDATQADIDRVTAAAHQTLEGRRDSERKSRDVLLSRDARDLGITDKTYYQEVLKAGVGGTIKGTTRDSEGNFMQRTVTQSNWEAAAEKAATSGDIPFLEDERMKAVRKYKRDSSGNITQEIDLEATEQATRQKQAILDDIIARNASTVMGKGGYHLATMYDLAVGKTMTDSSGNKVTLTEDNIKGFMDKARLEQMFGGASATDVGNMKFGEAVRVAETLQTKEGMDTFLSLSAEVQGTIINTLNDTINLPGARSAASEKLQYIVRAANAVNQALDRQAIAFKDGDIDNFVKNTISAEIYTDKGLAEFRKNFGIEGKATGSQSDKPNPFKLELMIKSMGGISGLDTNALNNIISAFGDRNKIWSTYMNNPEINSAADTAKRTGRQEDIDRLHELAREAAKKADEAVVAFSGIVDQAVQSRRRT
jgi:hypothetical protein